MKVECLLDGPYKVTCNEGEDIKSIKHKTDHYSIQRMKRKFMIFSILVTLVFLFWMNLISLRHILPFKTRTVPDEIEKTNINLMEKHPLCFSKNLFETSQNSPRKMKGLKFKKVAKYQLIGNDVIHPERYNHLCPFYLKDRYNCARSDSDIQKYGNNPCDWKLVLQPYQRKIKPENRGECNLWDLIHDIGGPAGVARKKIHDVIATNNSTRPYNVLLIGNSFLRQIFEALACTWSDDLTDYRALTNSNMCDSKDCTKQRIKERGENVYTDAEIGTVESLLGRLKKLTTNNKPSELKKQFYRSGVEVPPENVFGEEISDNLAMIEFDQNIRFYFIFRFYTFGPSLKHTLKKRINLDLADVDFLICNDKKHIDTESVEALKSTGVWQSYMSWNIKEFISIQKKNIGRWFGADNPWITHVPDDHACMPGPVDDEVNLVLFMIFSKATMV